LILKFMKASRANGSIAKIIRPRISGVFPRRRLFSLLDKHLYSSAIWISALAGSGKTTLVASYLTERELPCIWYQIDEGDADIATFFYYMGRAAAKAAPRKRPLPLFTPEYLQWLNAFSTRYFETLYSRLRPPFAIVFDNYQMVSPESHLHQVMCAGLENVLEGIHIICISREDPPAQFARLRANGVLRLVASEEIGFTLDESHGLVYMKGFKGLSDKSVQCLHERTRGWAAGLVLMLERARRTGVESLSSSCITTSEVFDYFNHELFERVDHEMREFLVKTAFLPKMTAQMAKSLTGIAHSGKILDHLYQHNLFISRDIQHQSFYQYHPMFRKFLKSRVEDFMTPEEVFMIRRDSAFILEETGLIEAAAGLLINAGDWAKLVSLVLSCAPEIVRQGRSETLESWLKAFPNKFFDKVPWLLYWKGVCNMSFNPGESLEYFKKAHQLFKDSGDDEGALISWAGLIDACFYH
jgi:LuxR family transcriptional regulator, maltose regulon positive regulatory protein